MSQEKKDETKQATAVTRSNKADFSPLDFIATDAARECGISPARIVIKTRGELKHSTMAESFITCDVQEQKATQTVDASKQTSAGSLSLVFLFMCQALNDCAFRMLRLSNDVTKNHASECFESVKTLAGVMGIKFKCADHEQEKKDETIMATTSKMIWNLTAISAYKLDDDVKHQIKNVFGCMDKICREQRDRITALTDCCRLIRVAERTEALAMKMAQSDFKSTTAFATKLAASMQSMVKMVRDAQIVAEARLSKWDHNATSFYKDNPESWYKDGPEHDAADESQKLIFEDRIKDEWTRIRVCACRQSDSRILSLLDQVLELVDHYSVENDKEVDDEMYS